MLDDYLNETFVEGMYTSKDEDGEVYKVRYEDIDCVINEYN